MRKPADSEHVPPRDAGAGPPRTRALPVAGACDESELGGPGPLSEDLGDAFQSIGQRVRVHVKAAGRDRHLPMGEIGFEALAVSRRKLDGLAIHLRALAGGQHLWRPSLFRELRQYLACNGLIIIR